jgi:hypothetical protein
MAFYEMLELWMDGPRTGRRPEARLPRQRGVRLVVEQLEDRIVPSFNWGMVNSPDWCVKTGGPSALVAASAGNQPAPLHRELTAGAGLALADASTGVEPSPLHRGGHRSYGGGLAPVDAGTGALAGLFQHGGKISGDGNGTGGLP